MADEFEAAVAALAGTVPIALLPVRLEARFVANALLVRIFPDQVHIDAHEPLLTSAERDAGMKYWRQRFAEPNAATRSTTPWTSLSAAMGPARAAWVLRQLTPTNLAQISPTVAPIFPTVALQDAEWSRAARATALPERWLVVGQKAGAEIFRQWSAPVSTTLDVTLAPDSDTTPVADDAMPLQPTARWLVDFDVAEKSGMAVRIPRPVIPNARIDPRIDRLLVIGVDWKLSPELGAKSLRTLFASHVHTDGLSALEPGTPTNDTSRARPGSTSSSALADALDPEKHPTVAAIAGSGIDRFFRALGIVPASDDLLTGVPGATSRDQEAASHLATLLWESTLGAYLTDFMSPNLTDAATGLVRDHARTHLFPAGPYPALRIGKQPYGVLPVVARGRYTPAADDRLEQELFGLLEKLRPFWANGTARVPRLGRTGNLDDDLTSLLQTTPLSSTFRIRSVLGPLAVNATVGLARQAATLERTIDLLGTSIKWPRRPLISDFTVHQTGRPLRVPLVEAGTPVPGAPLSKNYLREIADVARGSGTYDAIKARENASALLESLTAYAIGRELHRGDIRTIDRHRVTSGVISALPAVAVAPPSEYVAIEAVARPAAGAGVLVTAPSEAARIVIPAVTGAQTVRQFVTNVVRKGAPIVADYRSLGEALTSLEWLATRPVDQLERGLRGLLDAYAYRLDAWYTSLATRRLSALRAAAPVGIHVGAYGWLDDLQPASAPTSKGFLHAPSLGQAATAAVLRSGHLAHDDDEHRALDIDLSSARVRAALTILDGVGEGQPLAAILGYRFERALRTRSLTLARYILPIRRATPLRSETQAAPSSSASENIAARDVVDGVMLLERWRAERTSFLAAILPGSPQADRDAIGAELDRLADLYDAVADVMIAEAVHQQVLGNSERAGGVLAALDRHERAPAMDFVRTPRSGRGLAHRVLVLIGADAVSPAWRTLSNDARAAAEPKLNAWIARIIGEPGRVAFAASVANPASSLTIPLAALGLSPLSLVLASAAPGNEGTSELDERLIAAFAEKVTGATEATEIVLGNDAPVGSPPGTIGLAAFRALMRWIYDLVSSHRPATAADLLLPQDGDEEALDDVEVAARADALLTKFIAALGAVDAALAVERPSVASLRRALQPAAAFGVRSAVPRVPPIGAAPVVVAAMRTQSAAVVAEMRGAISRERAAVAAAGSATTTPQERVKLAVARIRAVMGEHFPVLPRFVVRNAVPLAASLKARATLTGADELAPWAWLEQMSLVRPGAGRLARVLSAADMLGSTTTPSDLAVVQLPHVVGERWVALPFTGGVAPEGELAIVAHTTGAIDVRKPLAGIFLDGWSEVVPSREETTGVAFHFDAPNARAPQAIVLATPASVGMANWSVDAILDTVSEAHDLARLRAVGPKHIEWIGTVLPALYLPVSASPDVPAVDLDGLVLKYAAINAATATVLGKG
ncbi:MAG: hypothetical protein ABIP93_08655 [Gemmatimonadaceae bacterium]